MRNPFRRKALSATPEVLRAIENREVSFVPSLGGTNQQRISAAWEMAQSQSYGWMYLKQPAVRTVVDFIARNIAQLGLKLYERVDDNQRERAEDHPAAATMRRPYGLTPYDRWIFDFVADRLVYGNAYAIKFRAPDNQRLLLQIEPWRMNIVSYGREVDGYRVYNQDGTVYPNHDQAPISPENVLHWRTYNPDDRRVGLSPLETLRDLLAEDLASQTANTELLKSGLMKPGWVYSPVEAPMISNEARQAAEIDLYNRLTRKDKRPPFLEEGRELRDMGVTPKDAEMLAGRRFTEEQVARLFGVPTGALSLDPSGDLEEQRKQVYADVLPPYSKELSCVLDVGLLQVEYQDDDYYFEFDLNEKLRGDPQARFQAITSAVGRPWMLVDEARTRENLPQIDGGEDLALPLNVSLAGDQGSPSAPQLPAPNVMPPQDPNKPPQDGSYRENSVKALTVSTQPRIETEVARQRRYINETKALLLKLYRRQLKVLNSKGLFDSGRWNREFAEDLQKQISSIVEREGGIYTARLGGDDFDMRERAHYIDATAKDVAESLNATTQKDYEGDLTARQSLERAMHERAAVAGTTLATRITTFARREAASSSPGAQYRSQTWVADTDRHAELDGVSVPLGSDWGGISPGSEPNCACSAVIS